ncbi:hypothetical protein UFOVP130_62 [uncultured Caudovirales phage]|uniref:Uncharacterized protein n=1 Tax=uncultured Caudovirales phage TaxID=2100421 RepID=A0A6J5LDV4_9CAUD|nr:hypothetical protein UFOVP130_62 [uncultured Caudovirales phage]
MQKQATVPTLKIPKALHTRLKIAAAEAESGLGELAERILWAGVEQPHPQVGDPQSVPSAEQTTTTAQPDILAGLKPDDAQAVREFVEILRGEDEWLRNMAMMAIESSRRLKAPQVQERAVADVPVARKAKSRG